MSQQCGNCTHHADVDMNQGEVTEVRCMHPTVKLATGQHKCPDWIIDANAFNPYRHGKDCSAWEPEVTVEERIRSLEDRIREQTPELGVLSNMGISFLERAFAYYAAKPKDKS